MIGINKGKFSGLSRALRFKNAGVAVLAITVCVSGMTMGFGLAYGSEASKSPLFPIAGQTTMTGAGGIHFASTPSPAMADPCLPLLKQVRLPSDSAIDNRTRRSAGHHQKVPAVAIGYVLGLRHAPGPREILHDDIGRKTSRPAMADSDTDNSYALAVADYRTCRRNLELSLLGQG